MAMDGTGLSVADALALERNNDDWGGGGSWIWMMFLFFLLAWGGNGFYGNRGADGSLTRAEMQQGFDTQNIENGIRGIQQGLCDGFYAMNTGLLNGFNGVQRDLCTGFANVNAGINQSRFDAQQCCCETNRNIDSVRFQNQQNACDIMQNNDRNTQRIIDHMTQNEMQTLRDQLQSANFQLSQLSQTSNLVEQLRPCPIPAYLSCSPYTSYDPYMYARNGFGFFNNGCGCNSGCGC